MESNEPIIVLDQEELAPKRNWKPFLYLIGNLFFGVLSFVFSLGIQINLYLLKVIREREDIGASIVSTGFEVKIFILLLALIGLFFGWKYLKSGDRRMKIVNFFGLMLGSLAIVFTLIPFYIYL